MVFHIKKLNISGNTSKEIKIWGVPFIRYARQICSTVSAEVKVKQIK